MVVVALITARRGGGSGVASGGRTTTPEPTTTTVPPITPAACQQALTDLDAALAPGFRQLAGAASPPAIDGALGAIQSALSAPLPALRELVPPPDAAAANAALIGGLEGLQSELSPVSGAADSSSVCLGSAATALLSRGADLGALRAEIGQLAASSFHAGDFLPPVIPDVNRTLATGAIVDGRAGHGEGWLDITNGGQDDATVGLFTRDCQFQKFDDPFTFTTTSAQATTDTITLTPVFDGTASVSEVDPNTYPR